MAEEPSKQRGRRAEVSRERRGSSARIGAGKTIASLRWRAAVACGGSSWTPEMTP